MAMSPPPIFEGNDYYSVPEEIFNKLPADLRAPFEQIMKKGAEIISGCDKEIESLIRLVKAIPTSSSLGYIYHRLRTTKFEITTESMMEHEMLTTAFVVSYARLFAKSNGTCVLQRSHLPTHLRAVHDELYKIRNERYAHNGGHESIDTSVGFAFSGTQFHIQVQMSLGLHIGGRNEWEDLIKFVDALMYERLNKILARLKEQTGYEWLFPDGPTPSWVGGYDDESVV
ncbi:MULTISPECIES: hypothetical protein [Pectobacterium]|uniref:hypothetical protein n=1 Tax=Pectobacterium TaxID=122277 RepID=UPI0013FE4A08|nr:MULTISPECIES: hypothetical protein [Pectobacterium]MCU1802963.1 hypothetical protein [Pectobacterium parvum]